MRVILLLVFLSTNSFSFTMNKTKTHSSIRWITFKETIYIYVDYKRYNNSTLELSDSEIKSIISESISHFSGLTSYKLVLTNDLTIADATIEFSNKLEYFGSGTLGLTSLEYSSNSGEISSAKILINDTIASTYTLSASKYINNSTHTYFGNIITHELGHLMGMDHSEVIRSSMFFSVFRGQDKLSSDDKNGLQRIYKKNNGNKITGKVVGKYFNPAYHVHVRLYSADTNEVEQGVVTNTKGEFEFHNVEKYKKYYISIDKIYNPNSVSYLENNTNYRYCNQKEMVLSSFNTCYNSERSFPQVFHIEKSSLDLGYLKVSCNPGINTEYLVDKLNEEYYLLPELKASVFWGYFSESEIDAKEDLFEVDFRAFEISTINPKLHLKLNLSSLYNLFDTDIYLKRDDQVIWTQYSSSVDADYNYIDSDLDIEFPLSTTESNNLVKIKVVPKSISNSDLQNIIGSPKIFEDVNRHYILSYSLDDEEFNDIILEDNSSCLEGDIYSKPNDISNTSSNGIGGQENALLSCGSINNKNSKQINNILLNLVFGFFLAFIFLRARKASNSLS